VEVCRLPARGARGANARIGADDGDDGSRGADDGEHETWQLLKELQSPVFWIVFGFATLRATLRIEI